MKVIVYGGSGFLGSYISENLSERGIQVRIFDREKSKYLRANQEMVIGDITNKDDVIHAARGCDYIYNCAAVSDLNAAKAIPIKTAEVNVLGNIFCLEAAVANDIKRYVFASTVYVYSEKGSFYRVSKQAAERYIEAYNETFGVPYTILRYGSLYGRRAPENNGVKKLLQQALKEGEIVYDGDSEAMREYIHVVDAARLSVDILDPQYANKHLIITGQERIPVKAMMRMIAEMVPGGAKIRFNNDPMYGHYVMTPYNYHPKLGLKLTASEYIELGQGLMDCLADIHEQHYIEP